MNLFLQTLFFLLQVFFLIFVFYFIDSVSESHAFLTINSASICSIFSGLYCSIFFSSNCNFMNSLYFCLNSTFLYRFSFALRLKYISCASFLISYVTLLTDMLTGSPILIYYTLSAYYAMPREALLCAYLYDIKLNLVRIQQYHNVQFPQCLWLLSVVLFCICWDL